MTTNEATKEELIKYYNNVVVFLEGEENEDWTYNQVKGWVKGYVKALTDLDRISYKQAINLYWELEEVMDTLHNSR